MEALLAAEKLAVGSEALGLDRVSPGAQCIFAPYQYVRVVDPSPDEIDRMVQGQTG